MDDDVFVINSLTSEDISNLIDSLDIPDHIDIDRQYQSETVKNALNYKILSVKSPTASGKSFMIYLILEWLMSNTDKQIAIIVPTTALVEQMYGDFADYGLDVELFCERIYDKYSDMKQSKKRIYISTWQSMHKMYPEYFHRFGTIIGDEAHGFAAKSLRKIMDNCINAEYRIGTTGTLPESKADQVLIEGLFGPLYIAATTKELRDEKYINEINPINIVSLNYSETEKKVMAGAKYQDEIDFIISHKKRNEFIKDLALSTDNNTLVMFSRIETHGVPLYELIKENAKDRNVYYVSGKTKTKDREIIRKIVNEEKNAIVVASVVFSTGTNIPNLNTLIFSAPTKSVIKIPQSIGRILRKSDINSTVYDIVDNLEYSGKINYSMQHAYKRLEIYAKDEFLYNYTEVNL